jgi:hypothetical protein
VTTPSDLRNKTRALARRLGSARLDQGLVDLRTAARFAAGRSCLPPPPAKRAHLLRLLRERRHTVFVESGTYLGDTVAFIAKHAEQVVSVELHDELWRRAVERFADAPNVDIRHGDGLDLVPAIVARLTTPPLIWLDGHYSGEGTALGRENEPAAAILRSLGDVSPVGTTVVIDDLRLFGTGDYARLDELVRSAAQAFPAARVRTGLDSLVIEA